MMVGMVDERSLRLRQEASGRQPSNPQPVAPTPSLFERFESLLRAVNPLARRNDVSSSLMGPTATTLANANAPFTTGAIAEQGSAGLGDVAKDLGLYAAGGALGAGVGLGVRAAVPVARTAMGTTARTLANNEQLSPGVRNVMELINARHASPNPNLGGTLRNPADVPVVSGRDFGPGFYYEAGRPLDSVVPYKDLLARYGDNFYMPQMSPAQMLAIARSRGGADLRQDLGLEGVNRVSQMPINDPVFRRAMEEGFTGVKGRTSWLVGNPERVGGLPNIGVRPVTAADDATYPQLESLLRRLFSQ